MAAVQQSPNLADTQIRAVREHLAQILSSPEFSSSERSRQLLRFLVETALTGNAEQLKEYVIALEVFDRSSDYDPRIDSTVRVQVSKLRERLKEYYSEPERQSGLRIDVPKGGYAPVFFFPSPQPLLAPQPSRGHTIAWVAASALALGLLIGVVSAWFAFRSKPPVFRQVTFRRAPLGNARFSRNGNTIIYSSRWDNNPSEVFSTSPDSPESRPLGFHNAELLAIAPNGTAALLNQPVFIGPPYIGTLATTPLTGTSPREMLDKITDADWSPDSSKLAVVAWKPGKRTLEFPPGKVLYESSPTGWISNIRISPQGDRIAFLDHRANLGDDEGWVATVDLAGHKTDLAGRFASMTGLAWAASGKEIWFTASEAGMNCILRGVTLSGRQRVIASLPSSHSLRDVAPDGRVLLSAENVGVEMEFGSVAARTHSDMSWLDGSLVRDISADGSTLLFDEEGDGGGATSSVYVRKVDGSTAVRLASGFGLALSPDGKWVLARQRHISPPRMILFPTGPGEERPLIAAGISFQEPGSWFADGRRLLLMGSEPGHGLRNYVYELETNRITAVTPEGVAGRLISPNMKEIAIRKGGSGLQLFSLDGSGSRPIPGTEPGDIPLRWSAGGRYLFVCRGGVPMQIYRVSLRDGKREPWTSLKAADPSGVITSYGVVISADGDKYAYSFLRSLSNLFLVEGLR
jgi:Tol biopolymer transport system component